MGKFNEVVHSVLKEEIEDKLSAYRQISDLLSAKGLKAFEQNEILDVVEKAIKMAFKEGYKAAEQNPFK
jgi:hypothetical protein